MIPKKKKNNPFDQGGHTLFDNALEIIGDVHFGGTLDIEGRVKGNIVAEATGDALVNIRSKGEVTGEIHAPKIIINGNVHGDVYCSKHLELSANALVNGDVHYKVIEMVKGAQVNGKLMHISEEQENLLNGPDGKPDIPPPEEPKVAAKASSV